MGRKIVKVKRYKTFTYDANTNKKKVIKTLIFVLILCLIFGGGFLFAKPVLDAASGFWYNVVKNQGEVVVAPSPAPSQDNSENKDDQTQVTPQDMLNTQADWQFVNIIEVLTKDQAEQKAAQLKQNGIEYAVFKLKDTQGNVYYESQNTIAQNAKATNTIDLKQTIEIFEKQGVFPVAQICAYQDANAALQDRTMAVKYTNEGDVIWLDTLPELGGKPWLNPYSEKAQNYINELVYEVSKAGFKNIILDKFQFPYADFGTNICGYGGQEQTVLKTTVLNNTLDMLVQTAQKQNAEIWLTIPTSTVEEQAPMIYGESPLNIKAKNVIFTVSFTRNDLGEVLPVSNITTEKLKQIQNTAVQNGTENFGLYIVDNTLDTTLAENYYSQTKDLYKQQIR